MATTKERIFSEINASVNGYINASALSRKYQISRQRVWQILEELGETRHKRSTKRTNTCRTCGTSISRGAINCRIHSKTTDDRKEGFNYICRLCGQYKPLEQFVKNKKSKSGYETRCLDCRAAWQREYTQTNKGRSSHRLANKKLADRHPERARAYYRVHRALKQGTLQKASQCEESECTNTTVQAFHTDYSLPLAIKWLCRLHAKRRATIVKEYAPNPIELRYRQFVHSYVGYNNSPGRWLAVLKTQYGGEITHAVLLDALKNHNEIQGLGRKFRSTTKAFLDEVLESLD